MAISFAKRERERARLERQRQKEVRRRERRAERTARAVTPGQDADIAAIVPGPQAPPAQNK